MMNMRAQFFFDQQPISWGEGCTIIFGSFYSNKCAALYPGNKAAFDLIFVFLALVLRAKEGHPS